MIALEQARQHLETLGLTQAKASCPLYNTWKWGGPWSRK